MVCSGSVDTQISFINQWFDMSRNVKDMLYRIYTVRHAYIRNMEIFIFMKSLM